MDNRFEIAWGCIAANFTAGGGAWEPGIKSKKKGVIYARKEDMVFPGAAGRAVDQSFRLHREGRGKCEPKHKVPTLCWTAQRIGHPPRQTGRETTWLQGRTHLVSYFQDEP